MARSKCCGAETEIYEDCLICTKCGDECSELNEDPELEER